MPKKQTGMLKYLSANSHQFENGKCSVCGGNQVGAPGSPPYVSVPEPRMTVTSGVAIMTPSVPDALSTQAAVAAIFGPHPRTAPLRWRLPDERKGITRKFRLQETESLPDGTKRLRWVKGYLRTGCYEDGGLGEIFIKLDKEGGTSSGFADCFAIAISLLLQSGMPLEKIAEKFIGQRFEPAGFTGEGEEGIASATSVVDYVFKLLLKKYGKER